MKIAIFKVEFTSLSSAEESELEFALAAQVEDDFVTMKDYKFEISNVCQLKTEMSDDVLHEGSNDECLMVMNAMIKYGIRADKFIISHK